MIKDLNRTRGSEPEWFTRLGRTVFFVAHNRKHHETLWRTGGSAHSTRYVPRAGRAPKDLLVVGRTLFYTATDGAHGRELWRASP
jgi:hypothetical protein